MLGRCEDRIRHLLKVSRVLHGFALLVCWRMMAEPNTVIIDVASLKAA